MSAPSVRWGRMGWFIAVVITASAVLPDIQGPFLTGFYVSALYGFGHCVGPVFE